MTDLRSSLRLVTDPDQHSVRVPPAQLTAEDVADLEALARHVLTPALAVARQLEDALLRRDVDRARVAAVMFTPVALNARDLVRQMETE